MDLKTVTRDLRWIYCWDPSAFVSVSPFFEVEGGGGGKRSTFEG